MPCYICKSCNFTTKNKYDFNRHRKTRKHLKNKKMSKSQMSEISIIESIEESVILASVDESETVQEEEPEPEIEAVNDPVEENDEKSDVGVFPDEEFENEQGVEKKKKKKIIEEITKKEKKRECYCIYCDRFFSRPDALKRHHKTCKLRNSKEKKLVQQLDTANEKIKLLEKQLSMCKKNTKNVKKSK